MATIDPIKSKPIITNDEEFVDLTTPPEKLLVESSVKRKRSSVHSAAVPVIRASADATAACESDSSDSFVSAVDCNFQSKIPNAAKKIKNSTAESSLWSLKSSNAESDLASLLKQPGSVDQEKLNILRLELNDISLKEAALRLREKKVRQEMKKVLKRIQRAASPTPFITAESVIDIGDTVQALCPLYSSVPSSQHQTEDQDVVPVTDKSSLWKMAQLAQGFEEGVVASLGNLKQATSLETAVSYSNPGAVSQKIGGEHPSVMQSRVDSPLAVSAKPDFAGETRSDIASREPDTTNPVLAHVAESGALLSSLMHDTARFRYYETKKTLEALELVNLHGAAAKRNEGDYGAESLHVQLEHLVSLLEPLRDNEPQVLELYHRLRSLLSTHTAAASDSTTFGSRDECEHSIATAAQISQETVLQELQHNLQQLQPMDINLMTVSKSYLSNAIASCFAARCLGYIGRLSPRCVEASVQCAACDNTCHSDAVGVIRAATSLCYDDTSPAANALATSELHMSDVNLRRADGCTSYEFDQDSMEDSDFILHYVPESADPSVRAPAPNRFTASTMQQRDTSACTQQRLERRSEPVSSSHRERENPCDHQMHVLEQSVKPAASSDILLMDLTQLSDSPPEQSISASIASCSASVTAAPAPPLVSTMTFVPSSRTSMQAYEKVSPKDIFSLEEQEPPDFASMAHEKQLELGAHFGLKFSANLPRILSDIWRRMRKTADDGDRPPGSKGGVKAAPKSKTGAPKKNAKDISNVTGETAKIKKSKISTVSATSASNVVLATVVAAQAVTDDIDNAVVACLQTTCADLYEKMLLFLPVDLEELHSRLHVSGVKVSKIKLQKLLDRGSVFVSAGSKPAAVSKSRGKKS